MFRLGKAGVRLLGTASVLAVISASAYAQSDGEESPEGIVLDTIVISAGQEKVQSDTPQSVSVVTQEDLDREQPTTVGDLFEDLPGVTATGTERVLGERFNIRGFGGDSFDGGDERRIVIQVDGATKFYQQYRLGALFTDPELYKRIEVLRGPASSTLYGSGALAGVITLETKDASDFLEGEDRFAGRLKLEGSSNGAGYLVGGIFAARPVENIELLAALNYRRYGSIEDGAGAELAGSSFDAPSGLIKLGIDFGSDNEHRIEASYQHWTTEESGGEYEQTSTSAAFGDVDREVTDQTAILNYYYQPDNDLIDFEATVSYSNTEVSQRNATNPLGIPSTLFQDSDYAYETWQGRIENTFTFGSEDDILAFLTVGAQVSEQTRVGEAAPFFLSPNGFIAFQPGGTDFKIAGYAQAEVLFPFGLTLIPGLRYEYSELEPDGLNTSFSQSVSNTAISPKLAVLQEITDEINIFASVAYTERLPVLDEVFDGNSGNLLLEPESALNFDVGVSYSSESVIVDGDALVAKLTFFRNDVENLIDRATQADPYFNVNQALIQGVEFEAGYDTGEYFARVAATAIRGENETTGTPLTSIPADQVSVTVGRRFLQDGITIGARGVFARTQDDLPVTSQDTPGYGIMDLFASWEPNETGPLKGTQVRLSIGNVFDKTYQPHLSNDNGRGRTFRLTFVQPF
ncbi:MAG: TonB-dependent receptor [Pseudomonadota bacterium]